MQLLADLTLLDLKNMEQLIIVDNGSKPEFLSELKQTLYNIHNYYPDFKYTLLLREYNFLFSKSNNYAIEFALNNSKEIQYIILINPDISVHFDYWSNESNPFDIIIDQMIENNATLAGAKLLYGNGTIEHAGGIDNTHIGFMQPGDLFDTVSEVEWVTGALMVINISLIKEIGYLDEINCPHWVSDQEYCRRASLVGNKIICSPVYFTHAQGRSTEKESHEECAKDLPPGFTYKSTVHTLEQIKDLAIQNSKSIPKIHGWQDVKYIL
jgi:O-antigen biosynthesis protein